MNDIILFYFIRKIRLYEPSLIDIFTSPCGCNFEDANNNKLTKNNIMVHTTRILAIVVVKIIIN